MSEVFEPYDSFAQIYDLFMDQVPYEKWADFITCGLRNNGVSDGLVLDLGCGTGRFTKLLKDRGYDMIGVDSSAEMLRIAMEADPEVLWLNQDMRSFELYGTVRAIVSVCDCLNYITEPEELVHIFELANNYLDRDGLFIFDLNTPYKYRELLGENTFAENREDAAFIWDNIFDEKTGINEYELTFFKAREDGSFLRSTELHYERAYTLAEIKELLARSGMAFVKAFAGYSEIPLEEGDESDPGRGIERMLIVAREQYKEGKKYI